MKAGLCLPKDLEEADRYEMHRTSVANSRAVTAMPYTHRPTWPDESDDYVIRCEDLDVGRVYLLRVVAGDRWLWTIFMNGHVPKVEGVPISGLALTLHEAWGRNSRRSYELMREKARPAEAG